MNHAEQNGQVENRQVEDVQVEAALRNFRASVHNWSEQEYGRTRTIQRSRWSGLWRVMAHPAMVGTMTSALVIASVGIPVTVHHERQVAIERQAARATIDLQQKLAAEAAVKTTADTIDDEDLLSHVDSDIAQAAPDAMQPLVSMMSETSSK